MSTEIIALMLIVIGTTVGLVATTIGLYIHSDGKTHNLLQAIQTEMKDFHTRLTVIDMGSRKMRDEDLHEALEKKTREQKRLSELKH